MSTRTIVVLFTDLVQSTRLLTSLGEEGPAAIAQQHLSQLQEIVGYHEGAVIKTTGDGVMAVLPSASMALDCAVDIQRRLDGNAAGVPVGGRMVRIGISAGDATEVKGDWFGRCVNEAARLCALAFGGEILVSGVIASLSESTTKHPMTPRGPTELAGLSTTEVFEVPWARADDRPLTVVLADDSVLLRSGIAGLLKSQGFRIVGEGGNASELLALADALRPDLAIVDIRMPPTHTLEGIRAATILKSKYPEMGVLLLSQHLESRAALGLLSDYPERIGYLLKDRVADVGEFVTALRTIAGGGSAIDREVISRLMGRRRIDDPIEELTERELDVLSLMAEGLSNQAIQQRLNLTSVRTVESHIAEIFSKLGLEPEPDGHRRVLAVVAFLRRP